MTDSSDHLPPIPPAPAAGCPSATAARPARSRIPWWAILLGLLGYLLYGYHLFEPSLYSLTERFKSLVKTSFKLQRPDLLSDTQAIIQLAQLDQEPDAMGKVRKLRRFLHLSKRNGTRPSNKEPYFRDTAQVLYLIRLHHTEQALAPNIECGPISLAMVAVLTQMGITSRVNHLFAVDHAERIISHTLLGVHNPQSNTWEAQDPLNDVEYRAPGNDEPLGVADLVMFPDENILAVRNGQVVRKGVMGLMGHSAQAVLIDPYFSDRFKSWDTSRLERHAILLVEHQLATHDHRFSGNGNLTFLELVIQRFRNPVVINLHP